MADDNHEGLLEALDAIPVESCDYQTWVDVGMALHASGFSLQDWQRWSAQDHRVTDKGRPYYSERETAAKWRGFSKNRQDRVTSGTIIHLAESFGWVQPSKRQYGWDDVVRIADGPTLAPVTATLIDRRDVGGESFDRAAPADAKGEFLRWLRALFSHDDHVCIVARTTPEGKPSGRGRYDLTREELEDLVERRGLEALGEATDGGAFACVNPLDGDGREDKNVTKFKYALVESDKMDAEKQLALIHEMKLPCAAITWSGNKSVHAIVHIDAKDKKEYRERVAALYDHLRKNGFEQDEQNKNPSRLTRCPGWARGNGWQRLIEADQSEFLTWDEWQDWIVSEMTKLPDIETFSNIGELPPLAPEIISGVLRQKQKMLVVGPSKAGKSFLMIELAIAVAEGWDWFGHDCMMGKVLIINFEIQRASMMHRLRKVYDAMAERHEGGIQHEGNLDVWNLRGHSAPLNLLTPKLLRQAASRKYDLIIIDPIYKVLTGDENSASDMAEFCNQFDVIAENMGCTVVYCHHHAKGEAGRRAAMDRASGSGVFTRDPDAFLDMSPISVEGESRSLLTYEDEDGYQREALPYRVTYTLREFATPMPTDVLFKWPLHVVTEDLHAFSVVGEPKTRTEAGKASAKVRQDKADGRWAKMNELITEAHGECRNKDRFTVDWCASWIWDNRDSDCFELGFKTQESVKRTISNATRRKPDGNPKEERCEWVRKEAPAGVAAELEQAQGGQT